VVVVVGVVVKWMVVGDVVVTPVPTDTTVVVGSTNSCCSVSTIWGTTVSTTWTIFSTVERLVVETAGEGVEVVSLSWSSERC
jgi:hypothetical protein